ncbi:MAG TPA: hypothetical protein VIH61_06830 [Waddliaceae bacterium]
MKKMIESVLLLICCFSAVAYGIECDQSSCEITSFEACDQSPKCPRDKHPVGEDCPHQPS